MDGYEDTVIPDIPVIPNIMLSHYNKGQKQKPIITDHIIGSGTCSYVYKGLFEGIIVAVKKIKKSWMGKEDIENITNEINIHETIEHPNIINMIAYYEDSDTINIIMECADGNMMNIIKNSNRVSEEYAKELTIGIMEGIKYLHDKCIVHGDIKPENIIMKNNVPKICDFGFAKNAKIIKNKGLVGTTSYIAPEIYEGEDYTSKVDMWALGIIIFVMIGGYHPYMKFSCKYSVNSPDFYGKNWNDISSHAKDFISLLLKYNQNERMSVNDALKHEWLNMKI